MKVAIIGANGQLGTDLCEVFGKKYEVFPLTHAEIEIADFDNSHSVFHSLKPDLVLNTAAASNVPGCEKDPLRAYEINGIGALNLAKLSNELGFKLMHYSTDYVFDGKKQKPYVETDATNPQSVYAITKTAGENYIRNYAEKYFIVRVSGVYGKVPSRAKGNSNFISMMIKLANEKPEVRVVTDEILTPTWTKAIAENCLALAETDHYNIYHMTCEGETSWYEFAKTIFETLKIKTPLYPASVNDFPVIVKRPFYSVLDNYNLKRINLNKMPAWKDALIQFLAENYSK
jgi:dTDP-4-dehydrorhamnose reductase